MNNELLALLADDDTCVTPREVVHLPERVEREVEGEDRDGEEVEDHPADHVPFSAEEEDEHLESVDGGKHDN